MAFTIIPGLPRHALRLITIRTQANPVRQAIWDGAVCPVRPVAWIAFLPQPKTQEGIGLLAEVDHARLAKGREDCLARCGRLAAATFQVIEVNLRKSIAIILCLHVDPHVVARAGAAGKRA